jgi:hypothetical protein
MLVRLVLKSHYIYGDRPAAHDRRPARQDYASNRTRLASLGVISSKRQNLTQALQQPECTD